MMRCRTGTAQALALSRSKLVAVPDQRRTASQTSLRSLRELDCVVSAPADYERAGVCARAAPHPGHGPRYVNAYDRTGPAPPSSGALAALGVPLPLGRVPFDRVEGMLLGLAIGDSLGNTTEGQHPWSRRDIRFYEPNRYAGGRAVGVPSACRGGFQTRPYTLWTLEHLLEHDRIVPEQLLATFPSRREPQYPAHAWPNVYLQFLNSGTMHLPIEFAVAGGTRLQKSTGTG